MRKEAYIKLVSLCEIFCMYIVSVYIQWHVRVPGKDGVISVWYVEYYHT